MNLEASATRLGAIAIGVEALALRLVPSDRSCARSGPRHVGRRQGAGLLRKERAGEVELSHQSFQAENPKGHKLDGKHEAVVFEGGFFRCSLRFEESSPFVVSFIEA